IEALPCWGAALDRPNETRMISERHPMAIAQDAKGVGAVLLLLRRTVQAADILPTVSLIVVAIGATQTPTRGIGRAVGIIATLDKGLRSEVLVAPVIVEDCDTATVVNPVVVRGDVIGRVPQLHLPRQDWHSQSGAVRDELGALLGVGRIGGVAQGQ